MNEVEGERDEQREVRSRLPRAATSETEVQEHRDVVLKNCTEPSQFYESQRTSLP